MRLTEFKYKNKNGLLVLNRLKISMGRRTNIEILYAVPILIFLHVILI